jgi:hypothetical protein
VFADRDGDGKVAAELEQKMNRVIRALLRDGRLFDVIKKDWLHTVYILPARNTSARRR